MRRRTTRKPALAALVLGALLSASCARSASLPEILGADFPLAKDSIRFAVIGDTGTGGLAQRQIGQRLAEARQRFPFDFVLMLGDNLYGRERPQDYRRKFEEPYRPLLEAGVDFYAALGNHDDPNQRYYEPFHMDGKRFYAFSRGAVRFFALDSNYMDEEQVEWLEQELESTNERWKICFFHHPLYSSGAKHGSETDLRERLEPLFVAHGVDVVFAGHEHFYERIKPQKGIHHFISGAAAKLRRGNIRPTDLTERGFDQDRSFLLIEIEGDQMYFETITRTGATIDAGVVRAREDGTLVRAPAPAPTSGPGARPARAPGPAPSPSATP
jgi:3',5'-cyclic AMP phosphodiesterase CpdA